MREAGDCRRRFALWGLHSPLVQIVGTYDLKLEVECLNGGRVVTSPL